jgi:hypothetical protein
MASATFEDHPTDPDKMILRKPRLDQGADYERGFIDGMMYQTQTTVNKAVDAMSKRTWIGLTDEEIQSCWDGDLSPYQMQCIREIEAKLRELNA